jgi:hypothetical protein
MVGDKKGRREKATEELVLKGMWKYVSGGSWIVVKYLKFSRCWSLQRHPTMSGGFYDEKVCHCIDQMKKFVSVNSLASLACCKSQMNNLLSSCNVRNRQLSLTAEAACFVAFFWKGAQ